MAHTILKYTVSFITCTVVCLFGCTPEVKTEQPVFNQDKVKQQFIKANQQVVAKEVDEMDYYQKSHQMPFIKTTEGLYT